MRSSMPLLSAAAALAALTARYPRPAHAYEVDNFTGRETLKEDALPVLDQRVNQILRRAVASANRESPDQCNRMLLRQEIVRWVGPDPVSFLEFWATFTGEVQQTHLGLKQSIYSGVSITESPSMWFAGIGRSIKLGGHIVGTDKIGHFFMQGLDYFKRVQTDHEDLAFVLQNEHSEDGIWGLKTSGVKSYADMAANYQGYRFWSQLYQGEAPYVRCEQGRKWTLARDFTWADYVSDAWDEAINCSEMKPELAERVSKNLDRMGKHCPVEPKRCLEISHLDKAEFYMSPVCRAIAQGGQAPPLPPSVRHSAMN